VANAPRPTRGGRETKPASAARTWKIFARLRRLDEFRCAPAGGHGSGAQQLLQPDQVAMRLDVSVCGGSSIAVLASNVQPSEQIDRACDQVSRAPSPRRRRLRPSIDVQQARRDAVLCSFYKGRHDRQGREPVGMRGVWRRPGRTAFTNRLHRRAEAPLGRKQ
jgi:hypothetical protein